MAAPDAPLRPGVTVVVPCKGRLAHLRETIPRLLAQRVDGELLVVVVDYGDPDGCFGWVSRQRHPNLCGVRVVDRIDDFSLSHARNCGARVAPHELVAFVDADARCDKRWLASAVAPIAAGRAVATIPDWRSPACGICAVATETFRRIGGFDEAFRGWGHEDIDLIERLAEEGAIGHFDAALLEMIPHSPALRVTHYPIKEWEATHFANRDLAAARSGPVNPDGFGRGRIEVRHSLDGAG